MHAVDARTSDELVLAYAGDCGEWTEQAEAEHDLRRIGRTGMSVVVDLSGVEEIDSLALGVLVLAQKRLTMNGGGLSLVCDRPQVLRQLERTGLDRTFAVRPTRP
jgi:anti-anti-sigma factor